MERSTITTDIGIRSLKYLAIIFWGAFVVPKVASAQIYYSENDTLWAWTHDNINAQPLAEASPYGIAADDASGYLYWSGGGAFGSNIQRIHTDSSEAELVVDYNNSIRGIALDTENSKIYWADLTNAGAVVRANFDGSDEEVVVDGDQEGNPTDGILDVAVDNENEKIYWPRRGAIMRANLDGSEVEIFVEITSYVQPGAIAVNPRDGFVYWTDSSSDDIMRAGTETREAEVLVSADAPAGLALDLENDKIYWVDDFFMTGEGGAISRVGLDGNGTELIMETGVTRGAIFVTGENVPTSNEQASRFEQPTSVKLHANYPNPFNPSTVISYELDETNHVRLEVFDLTGRKVATLMDQKQSSGTYQVSFGAGKLSSGLYFYRLIAGNKSYTRKMTLVK